MSSSEQVAVLHSKTTTYNEMLATPFKIDRVIKETHDTFTLEIEAKNDKDGYRFQAGQFNMLYVYGAGEVPISISGDPTKPAKLIHTTRAVGAVTKIMRKLKTGDKLGIRGPFGTNWPLEQAKGKDVVLVTGGIGLAPLRPCIYHILAHREQYNKLVLLYGARTPSDLLFKTELEKWRSRFDMDVHVTVDRSSGHWHGNIGVVTTLIHKAPFDPTNTISMVCGPEIMMRFTIMELQKNGLSKEQIYVSMERNMKCGIGLCGHCQLGGCFICKDGPVFRFDLIEPLFGKREL